MAVEVIAQSLDTVKSRIGDVLRRRERGLPPEDDEIELLQRALQAIEEFESRPRFGTFCECDCREDDDA